MDDATQNDVDPIHAFMAQGNPNVLNHKDAMKSDDHEQFLDSMLDEVTRLDNSEVWELFLASEVPKSKQIL